MFKNESLYINEIKNKVLNMSTDTISLAGDIKNLSEITYDYCAYNPDKCTANIITIIDIIKDKSIKLIDIIDLFSIEISNYNKK